MNWDNHKDGNGIIDLVGAYCEQYVEYPAMPNVARKYLNDVQNLTPIRSTQVAASVLVFAKALTDLDAAAREP